jgi:trk system potassium uptake protein
MRVIICGAGQVGYNIAAHLSKENYDITIIDQDAGLVAEAASDFDVNGLVGHASKPDILHKAGAQDADLLIAVTDSDEVNMIACQVGYSLFNIPKKIARIRDQSYLDPAWGNLYSRTHLPIDVIISPEREIAESVVENLSVAGTSYVVPYFDRQIFLIGVVCLEHAPAWGQTYAQISQSLQTLHSHPVCVIRSGKILLPDDQFVLEENDEVFLVAPQKNLQDIVRFLGHKEQESRRFLIVGGGKVGRSLARELLNETEGAHIKIIEKDPSLSQNIAELFSDVMVTNGDGLDKEILEEVDIASIETMLAVTNDDEANILCSLLAKQYGCPHVVTLVNNSAYTPLLTQLGIDTVISPKAITVSKIMKNIRKGRIKSIHGLRDNLAEIIEIEASNRCGITDRPLSELQLPKGLKLALVKRKDEYFSPENDLIIRSGDMLLILALQGSAHQVEKLFSVDEKWL